jgi:hypothetical protein
MADLISRPLIEITRALREKRLTAHELVGVAIGTPGSHKPVGSIHPLGRASALNCAKSRRVERWQQGRARWA